MYIGSVSTHTHTHKNVKSVSWLGSWERNSLFLCPDISTFNIYRRAWKCVLNQFTMAITLENPRASPLWKTLLFGVSFKWLCFVLILNEVSLRPEECLRSSGATVKDTCESTGGMVCMREITHAVQSGLLPLSWGTAGSTVPSPPVDIPIL